MQKHSGYGKKITESLPNHELMMLVNHTKFGCAGVGVPKSFADSGHGCRHCHQPSRELGWLGYPLGLAGEDIRSTVALPPSPTCSMP